MTFNPFHAPSFVLVADTGIAGFALQNAVPTILAWNVPNDGVMHAVTVLFAEDVTVALVGGGVQLTVTLPDGTQYNSQPGAAGAAVGPHGNSGGQFSILVQPGSTVTLHQSSALTGGAGTIWAQLWAN